MCGFTGIFSPRGDFDEELLGRMAAAISHRGPDDSGVWLDRSAGIGLAHRRLSIVDLSPAGHQPMTSASGRYIIAFNGEVYNHDVVRTELREGGRAPEWRGHSDTETLLAGFDAWGVQQTVERAVGMFAFAVWDRVERVLTLGRDRLGEKPLYFGWQGAGSQRVFLFGSELKALRRHPCFEGRIDRGAVCLQLRHNYIPAPYSIYEGISKLAPGSLLSLSRARPEPRVAPYWSVSSTAIAGCRTPFAGTADEAVSVLERMLKDAVRQQMVADVPLGAFLSGGVDSSTVVALMQVQSTRPVKTFSIGFSESDYNEAIYAEKVAQHLGTDHTELYVTAEQAMAVIPRLPSIYDEPFSDSSQIPTFIVSQLAREHVTVSLSGDAGDELFCGYNRYALTHQAWQRMALVPRGLRRLLARAVTGISPLRWNALLGWSPFGFRVSNLGDKIHKGAGVLSCEHVDELYFNLVSHWASPEAAVLGGVEPPTLLKGSEPDLTGTDAVQRMMALDMLTYLPDDILTKVDRAAMAVSLETRVPFLDHRVVEFAWSLPQSLKLRHGETKWALRQVLYRHVPKKLIERPKMGFGVPIDAWLRGPLREWAEGLLDESRLRREGYLEPVAIRKKWEEHLSGSRNWQYHLWDVLMFEAWLEENGHGS